jgi:hypothetical protein
MWISYLTHGDSIKLFSLNGKDLTPCPYDDKDFEPMVKYLGLKAISSTFGNFFQSDGDLHLFANYMKSLFIDSFSWSNSNYF